MNTISVLEAAKIVVLLVPLGNIPEEKFAQYCAIIQKQSIVSLNDLTPLTNNQENSNNTFESHVFLQMCMFGRSETVDVSILSSLVKLKQSCKTLPLCNCTGEFLAY